MKEKVKSTNNEKCSWLGIYMIWWLAYFSVKIQYLVVVFVLSFVRLSDFQINPVSVKITVWGIITCIPDMIHLWGGTLLRPRYLRGRWNPYNGAHFGFDVNMANVYNVKPWLLHGCLVIARLSLYRIAYITLQRGNVLHGHYSSPCIRFNTLVLL